MGKGRAAGAEKQGEGGRERDGKHAKTPNDAVADTGDGAALLGFSGCCTRRVRRAAGGSWEPDVVKLLALTTGHTAGVSRHATRQQVAFPQFAKCELRVVNVFFM